MKNKLFLISFLFLAFAFNLSFLKNDLINTQVFAVEIADAGTGGVQDQNLEAVGIELSDKLVLKDGTPVKEVFNSTDDMINLIVKVVFVAAGFFLFLMIVGAGFAMIAGDGKDKDKAKTTMTSALLGFIIMFAAYWIMQILQLLTGINMGF